jgi:UDP-glucose 4-epimerase
LASEGHRVVGFDRVEPTEPSPPHVREVTGDTTSYDQLARAFAGCDAVVHLAAYTNPYVAPVHVVHNDNVSSSYNALIAAQEAGIDVLCQASSVNAIGCHFSQAPHYDYFPIDEAHPTHVDDAYGLSKYICEIQADAVARANPTMRIASLRLHALVPDRAAILERQQRQSDGDVKGLWGYTTIDDAARACVAALTAQDRGHEAFYVVAQRTASELTSPALHQRFYPEVPLKAELSGHEGFYDLTKAERLLAWRPSDDTAAK